MIITLFRFDRPKKLSFFRYLFSIFCNCNGRRSRTTDAGRRLQLQMCGQGRGQGWHGVVRRSNPGCESSSELDAACAF